MQPHFHANVVGDLFQSMKKHVNTLISCIDDWRCSYSISKSCSHTLGCTKYIANSQHTATLVVLSGTAQGGNSHITWQPQDPNVTLLSHIVLFCIKRALRKYMITFATSRGTKICFSSRTTSCFILPDMVTYFPPFSCENEANIHSCTLNLDYWEKT